MFVKQPPIAYCYFITWIRFIFLFAQATKVGVDHLNRRCQNKHKEVDSSRWYATIPTEIESSLFCQSCLSPSKFQSLLSEQISPRSAAKYSPTWCQLLPIRTDPVFPPQNSPSNTMQRSYPIRGMSCWRPPVAWRVDRSLPPPFYIGKTARNCLALLNYMPPHLNYRFNILVHP